MTRLRLSLILVLLCIVTVPPEASSASPLITPPECTDRTMLTVAPRNIMNRNARPPNELAKTIRNVKTMPTKPNSA